MRGYLDETDTINMLTFWYSNHECIEFLAAAGTLWMRAFLERTACLGHFHHESVEVLAF